LCFLLCLQQTSLAEMAVSLDIAGHLAALHNSIVSDTFRPLHLRYLSFNPLDNSFKLLLDKGSLKEPSSQEIEATSKTLMQYFLIGLTLPNDTFWVNLRPDSPDQIIDDKLAQTDIGKIMLETDLQLKKDTASFTSPQTPEGKEYWDKLYKKAEELYGTQPVEIPTLTRPWIVPGEIIIRETQDSAYIYKATLKVMLEQDYLKNTPNAISSNANYTFKDERSKALNEYSTQLIRELIIPKLTKQVNSSKRYASLRQVYYSLIMAQWFKTRFKDKQGVYYQRIDTQDLTDLTSKKGWSKTTYFEAYKKSFAEGEYNVQEPVYTPTGQVIRSYFSGGENLALPINIPTGKTNGSISAIRATNSPVLNAGRNIEIKVSADMQAKAYSIGSGVVYSSMQTVTPSPSLGDTNKRFVSSPVTAEEIKKASQTGFEGFIADLGGWEFLRSEDVRDYAIYVDDLYGALFDPKKNRDIIGWLLRKIWPSRAELRYKRTKLIDITYAVQQYSRSITKKNYTHIGTWDGEPVSIYTGSDKDRYEDMNLTWACVLARKYIDPREDKEGAEAAFKILDGIRHAPPEGRRFNVQAKLIALTSILFGEKKEDERRKIIREILELYEKNPKLEPIVYAIQYVLAEDFAAASSAVNSGKILAASYPPEVKPSTQELPGITTNGGEAYFQRWNPEKVRNYALDEYIERMKLSSGHFAVHVGHLDDVLEDGYYVSRYLLKMFKGKKLPFGAYPSRAVHFSIDQAYYKDGRSIAFVCSVEALMENKAFLHSPFQMQAGELIPTEDFPVAGFYQDPLDISHRLNIDDLGILFIHESQMDKIANLKHPPKRIYIYSEDTLDEAINTFKNKLNFKDNIILSGEVVLARDDRAEPKKSNNVGSGSGQWFAIGAAWSPFLQDPQRVKSYTPEELCQIAENILTTEGESVGFVASDYADLLLDEALSKNPNLAKAYVLKGKIAYDDTRKAYLEKALQIHSYKVGNPKNLPSEEYKVALSEAELWAGAYESLGRIYLERMLLGRAMQCFKQADKIYSAFGIEENVKGTIAYTRALMEARRRVKKARSFSELKEILDEENILTISLAYKESLLKLLRYLDSGKYITNILLKYALEEAQRVAQRFTDIRESDQADKESAIRELVQIDAYVREIINKILGGDLGKANYDIIERRRDEFSKEIYSLKLAIEESANGSSKVVTVSPTVNNLASETKPETANSPVGGIDFRSPPIVTQAIANLSVNLTDGSRTELSSININLDEEWQSIERMTNSGIKPSTERIKEYAQASSALGKISQDKDKIILCISDILRQEEDSCCETDPVLRDILVILESIQQPRELKEIFIGKAIL